jgi:hypothetical protein
MDSLSSADAIIGTGRGALISAMFGSGWLGWGLGTAKAYNGIVAPIFGFATLFLLGCSIYLIRKGHRLRKESPATGAVAKSSVRKWFLLLTLAEVIAIALVAIVANQLHRDDLAADWCAMVVGLHFLPLAKIFRAPRYIVLGILMIVWCALCWALFQSSTIPIAASIGTGVLLWGSCVASLFRARQIAQSTGA